MVKKRYQIDTKSEKRAARVLRYEELFAQSQSIDSAYSRKIEEICRELKEQSYSSLEEICEEITSRVLAAIPLTSADESRHRELLKKVLMSNPIISAKLNAEFLLS